MKKKPALIYSILFLVAAPWVVWLPSFLEYGWSGDNGLKEAIKTTLPTWHKFNRGEM